MAAHPQRSWLVVEQVGDVDVVRFNCQSIVDRDVVRGIGDQLDRLMGRVSSPRMVLNLRGVEHMTSTMLGKFISMHKRIETLGGRLVLSDINRELLPVFKVTQLDRLLNLFPDEAVALQSF
jgi:anti-anti-sigma factor